ncbi:hypothetical protein GCM10009122_58210 [Fulvivirga kasyanovii]|uniref:Uncharacterized protein n=1 Tax=Fulvivirga kasyanovii TaxID=396812 RepID=A0ABW9RSB6_9BACT|nr:hypothetical protein [Fulvivirga kasyanovii]MTI26755.1 hypothetical protein [Fulvivirga kasyanovii]
MDTPKIRLELHKIIDQISDSRLLEAVYTLLSSQRGQGKTLSKEMMDVMLNASESDIQSGRLTDHQSVKEDMQSWGKK